MENLKFISKIRSFPVIYDPQHEDYNKLDKKQLAWEQLSRELNLSDVWVRNKWQNIKESYSKCIKRKNHLSKTNQMHLYKRYKYEEVLAFLLPHIIKQPTLKRKTKHLEPPKTVNPKLKKVAMSNVGDIPIENSNYFDVDPINSLYEDKVLKFVKEEQSESIVMEDAYGEIQDVIEIAPESPQETTLNFFLNLGHTCSTFPPLLQAQVKREVFEILSNAELMNLKNP